MCMNLGFLSSQFPWAVLWESGYWVKGYERFFLWLLLMIAKLLPQRLNRFAEHQLPGVTPEISSTEGQTFRSSLLPHDIRPRVPFCQLLCLTGKSRNLVTVERIATLPGWLRDSSSVLASPLFSKNPGKLELYEEIISGEGEGRGEA